MVGLGSGTYSGTYSGTWWDLVVGLIVGLTVGLDRGTWDSWWDLVGLMVGLGCGPNVLDAECFFLRFPSIYFCRSAAISLESCTERRRVEGINFHRILDSGQTGRVFSGLLHGREAIGFFCIFFLAPTQRIPEKPVRTAARQSQLEAPLNLVL